MDTMGAKAMAPDDETLEDIVEQTSIRATNPDRRGIKAAFKRSLTKGHKLRRALSRAKRSIKPVTISTKA